MAHVPITLKAGQPLRQAFGPARFLTVSSLGGAPGVDVDLEVAGFSRETLRGIRERDRIALSSGYFEAVTFTASVDCTIEVFASMIDLRLNNAEGSGVKAEIVGPLPLPVSTDRGQVPGAPLYVAGITYQDTPATAVVNKAPVAVAAAAVLVAAADATRVQLRLTNIGNDAVAIGAAGITWANRCVVLYPGDSIVEDKGAALAWYGIADAGTNASVAIQELKA